MNKILTVKINKNSFKDNYHVEYDNEHQYQQDCQYENNRIAQIYGMALPTEVRLHLLPSLVEKMKKIEKFCDENEVSKSKFFSFSHDDQEFSYAYLMDNGEHIVPSSYTELGMTYARPTFHEQRFSIVYDYLYEGFKLKLYYTTGYCEFLFETYFFQLD